MNDNNPNVTMTSEQIEKVIAQQDSIELSEEQLASISGSYEDNLGDEDNPDICPKCKSNNTKADGIQQSGQHAWKRFKCVNCGRSYLVHLF